jgi:hypothetical protein
MIGWLIGFIIFLALAFWPARVAAAKGHSFFLWFLISIPFWWITLFVVYFGLSDTTHSAARTEE